RRPRGRRLPGAGAPLHPRARRRRGRSRAARRPGRDPRASPPGVSPRGPSLDPAAPRPPPRHDREVLDGGAYRARVSGLAERLASLRDDVALRLARLPPPAWPRLPAVTAIALSGAHAELPREA